MIVPETIALPPLAAAAAFGALTAAALVAAGFGTDAGGAAFGAMEAGGVVAAEGLGSGSAGGVEVIEDTESGIASDESTAAADAGLTELFTGTNLSSFGAADGSPA